MEMSGKCQMPAGSVRSISPAETLSPGKRVLGRVAVVQGQRVGDFEPSQC